MAVMGLTGKDLNVYLFIIIILSSSNLFNNQILYCHDVLRGLCSQIVFKKIKKKRSSQFIFLSFINSLSSYRERTSEPKGKHIPVFDIP